MNRIKVLIGVIGKGKGGVPTYAVHLFSHLDLFAQDKTATEKSGESHS